MKNQIDWHSEWAKHAYQFENGYAHIDFRELGIRKYQKEKIKLAPGPGFGDFSHPTTRLVLLNMCQHVSGKQVLDVGCGSGILSIAACAFGAQCVHGIDIEEEAVRHARDNALLNGFSHKCRFGPCTHFQPDVLLMNMIRSEQKAAYVSLPALCQKAKVVITSGILSEEREAYLQQTASWGWLFVDEQQSDQWLSFRFEN